MVSSTGAPSAPPASWNLCAWPLRRKLRALWLLLVTAIFGTLPLLIIEMQKQEWSHVYQAWFLAGLFCVLTWTITMYEVALHLEYFSRPTLQRHIIRIMLMPPIYALDSWFCLRFIEARTVLTPVRELYEAYTIYNFFMYLMRYLEGQLGPVHDYMGARGTTATHIFPVNYFSNPWVGREMHRRCRNGVLNYVMLRPATAVVVWITLLSSPDRYEEGQFAWGNVWPYCMLINNFSQAWALYVLMLFYMAVHEELKPLNPLRKFVTIKLVVFASFWQGLLITLLAASGLLRPTTWRTYTTTSDFTGGLQDFIICIEMFFAAVGFAWAFPPRDYMTGEPPGIWQTFYNLFDFADVMDDVQGYAGAGASPRTAPHGCTMVRCAADRVHEEYRELTTQPIQKIMAPLRNNPLFFNSAKPKIVSLSQGSTGTAFELVPLTTAPQSDAPPRLLSPAIQPVARLPAGEASTSNPSGIEVAPFPMPSPGDRLGSSMAIADSAQSAHTSGGVDVQVSLPGQASGSDAEAPGTTRGGQAKPGLRVPARCKLQAHVD